MGTVYLAEDTHLGRRVAIKFPSVNSTSRDYRARFLREARAVSELSHPGIATLFDYGETNEGRPFLVMELLEGETLRQRLSAGASLSAADTLHILRGVCSALSAAHGHGLVHRDLKPENIFLQRHLTGVVPKVLDFGLAKAFSPHLPLERVTDSSAGLLVGTLDYMAPEQVAGDDVNPGWDVWAMGVIAYEMLTATHPFRRNVAFVADATMADLNPLDRTAVQRMPDAAANFFRTALSADRALRPSDPIRFLVAYEQALS